MLPLAGVPSGIAAAEDAPENPPANAEAPGEATRNKGDEEQNHKQQQRQAKKESVFFERVRVVGSPVKGFEIPGSITYLGREQLQRQDYADIHRVLIQVPGVNIQEEEGYGLRPNIGFRGSGAERSSKITLMEDGVLVAPAPYSAPSAYYFPTTGRMEGVEIRKGSSSIQQGPFTTAGVVNFLSSAIPSSFGGTVKVALGEDETVRGRARIGSSGQRFGWLVETFQMETDGFKELDGGGPTGFDLEDYLVKFRVAGSASTRMFQTLEIKLGKTEQFGHETYLGLTQADFERSPYRRYAASQEDTLDTDHEQVHLRHLLRPNRTLDLTTTVYRNEFFRNWRKIGKVEGVDIGDVLEDPSTFSRGLAILRGDVDSAPDSLNVRNNRREYYSQGVHTVLGIRPRESSHEIELGVRYHEDEEDRFQDEDLFQMIGGRMVLSATGQPGSQSNRISAAEAVALHAQDTISLNRWTVTAGIRLETIDFGRLDYGTSDPERTGADLQVRRNEVSEFIPGVGVTYDLSDASSLFAGVHKGFAPPGPGADEETEPEESTNYELGYRRSRGPLGLQIVGFFNDYDNLLGADTLSAGGTGEGDMFNGGEVETYGLEVALSYDIGKARDLRFGVPLSFTYTFTEAEFKSSFLSAFAGWGDQITAGDELPYVPEHQATLGIGMVRDRWSAYTNLIYQEEMRTRAGQGPIVEEESTDSYLLLDLSANYRLHSKVKLFVQVRNLTDKVYVAARRPAGARPGLPRTVLAGIAFDF